MQEFKMSLEELEEKFTKSEMGMMSWSSQESLASMDNKMKTTKRDNEHQEVNLEDDGLPRNEFGEVDISKMTGKQAAAYLGSKGLHFMPICKT